MGALVQGGLLTKTGILDLAASDEALHAAVAGAALAGPATLGAERDAKLAALVACVKHSRYANLYSLLKDHLSEKEYLQASDPPSHLPPPYRRSTSRRVTLPRTSLPLIEGVPPGE